MTSASDCLDTDTSIPGQFDDADDDNTQWPSATTPLQRAAAATMTDVRRRHTGATSSSIDSQRMPPPRAGTSAPRTATVTRSNVNPVDIEMDEELFAFGRGSVGHLLTANKDTRRLSSSLSNVSEEEDLLHSDNEQNYKYQQYIPVAWPVLHPEGNLPSLVTSEVTGPRAVSVNQPRDYWGLPIQPSFFTKLHRTMGELRHNDDQRNLAIGDIVKTKENRYSKAPYVQAKGTPFLPSRALKWNRVGPKWFKPVTADTTGVFTASGLRRLQHVALKHYRTVNHAATFGEAEAVLRIRRQLKRKEPDLEQVLAARELAFEDIYKSAHELLIMTSIMMRDTQLQNCNRQFNEEEIQRLRFAPLDTSAYVFNPTTLGQTSDVEPEDPDPTLKNQRNYAESDGDDDEGDDDIKDDSDDDDDLLVDNVAALRQCVTPLPNVTTISTPTTSTPQAHGSRRLSAMSGLTTFNVDTQEVSGRSAGVTTSTVSDDMPTGQLLSASRASTPNRIQSQSLQTISTSRDGNVSISVVSQEGSEGRPDAMDTQ